jgi:hypothetical protein
MTIGWVWGLVGTLGFFAFTLILEVVKLTRSLKSSDDELASARQKIATLEEKHNEAIADLKKLHQREMEELRNKITELSYNGNPSDHSSVILPTEQLDTLKLLYERSDLTTEEISNITAFQLETAKYHLKELEERKMVVSSWYRNKNEANFKEHWRIVQPGRKFLHVSESKDCEQTPQKNLPNLEEFAFQPEGFYTHPNFNHEICPKCLHQKPMKVVPVTNASGPWKCVSCDYKVSPKAACVSLPPEQTRRGGFVNSWRK